MKYNKILLIISVVIVILSLRLPAKVDYSNEIELKTVKLGYPISFVVQDWTGWSFQKWADAKKIKLNELKVNILNPWETPTKLDFLYFLLSIIITWLILIGIRLLILILAKALIKRFV